MLNQDGTLFYIRRNHRKCNISQYWRSHRGSWGKIVTFFLLLQTCLRFFAQLEFDPSVTDFKSLLDIFWAGHDPTVPAYSRQVSSQIPLPLYKVQHFKAVHVGNILPRRWTNETCQGVDEGSADWLEEGDPNSDPACRPVLPSWRVSLDYEEYIYTLLLYQSFFLSYHQKYILQKHGSLLTSIGLSRGPKLVASSLAARLNGYLGGYGTKVKPLFQNASYHVRAQENFLGETETVNQLNQEDIDYIADEIEQAISRRY